MSALLTVTIPGNPGDAAINTAWEPVVVPRRGHRPSYAKLISSDEGKRFRARAIRAIDNAQSKQVGQGLLHPNECSVVIRVYWGRQHRKLPGAVNLPIGDVDATIKAVLDALEHSGFLDDDTRVRTVTASKWLDKADPRIELEVHAIEVRPEHA